MSRDDVLADSGWLSVEASAAPTPFDLFVQKRGFSLRNDVLIGLPHDAIGLNFNGADEVIEIPLRAILTDLFVKLVPFATCYAIDVNHAEYAFVPSQLELTERFEPWPIPVRPWAEYASWSDSEFTMGIFCNPLNNHLVAYGGEFAKRFAKEFPDQLTAATLAASARAGAS